LPPVVGRDGRLAPVEFGGDAYPSADRRPRRAPTRSWSGNPCARRRSASWSCCATRELGRPGTASRRSWPSRGRSSIRSSSTRRATGRSSSSRPAVVRAHPGPEAGADRGWPARRLASGVHGLRFAQLDREPEPRLVHQRQRFFGVPFPVWYAVAPDGATDFSATGCSRTKTPCPSTRRRTCRPGTRPPSATSPGASAAEEDILDTWFTSSLRVWVAGASSVSSLWVCCRAGGAACEARRSGRRVVCASGVSCCGARPYVCHGYFSYSYDSGVSLFLSYLIFCPIFFCLLSVYYVSEAISLAAILIAVACVCVPILPFWTAKICFYIVEEQRPT